MARRIFGVVVWAVFLYACSRALLPIPHKGCGIPVLSYSNERLVYGGLYNTTPLRSEPTPCALEARKRLATAGVIAGLDVLFAAGGLVILQGNRRE